MDNTWKVSYLTVDSKYGQFNTKWRHVVITIFANKMGQSTEENPLKINGETTEKKLDYTNKIILAPMVKVGTLATRLLALRYGADIVYSEEIIDFKFLRSYRQVNGLCFIAHIIFNLLLLFIHLSLVFNRSWISSFQTCSERSISSIKMMVTSFFERVRSKKTKLYYKWELPMPSVPWKLQKWWKMMSQLSICMIITIIYLQIDYKETILSLVFKSISFLYDYSNMGCPKEFSLKGGMGAALLSDSERAKSILSTLVKNVKIPITCKIR